MLTGVVGRDMLKSLLHAMKFENSLAKLEASSFDTKKPITHPVIAELLTQSYEWTNDKLPQFIAKLDAKVCIYGNSSVYIVFDPFTRRIGKAIRLYSPIKDIEHLGNDVAFIARHIKPHNYLDRDPKNDRHLVLKASF